MKSVTLASWWNTDAKKLTAHLDTGIGSFDHDLVTPNYRSPTKEMLIKAKQLTTRYGIELIDFLSKTYIKSGTSLNTSLTQSILKSLILLKNITPACLSLFIKITSPDASPFTVSSIPEECILNNCHKDKQLFSYFTGLRVEIIKQLNLLLALLLKKNEFQFGQRLTQKMFQCIIYILNIRDREALLKTGVVKLSNGKNEYRKKFLSKNILLSRDHSRNYREIYKTMLRMKDTIQAHYQLSFEIPDSNIQTLLHHFCELLMLYSPKKGSRKSPRLMYYLDYLSDEISEEFGKEYSEDLLKKILVTMKKVEESPIKETQEEKVLPRAMILYMSWAMRFKKMLFSEKYLCKKVFEDILFSLLSTDRSNMQDIVIFALSGIEALLHDNIKFKYANSIQITPFSLWTEEVKKQVEAKSLMIRSKQEKLQELRVEAFMDIVNRFAQYFDETNKYLNGKTEPLIIAVLSILSSHFEKNDEMLTQIENIFLKSSTSKSISIRGFAQSRLGNLLALRQRRAIRPIIIHQDKYQIKWDDKAISQMPGRFSSINLNDLVKRDPSYPEIFNDTYALGFFAVPSYVKYYENVDQLPPAQLLSKQLKTSKLKDILWEQLSSNPSFASNLIATSIQDHETYEEQDLMKENENRFASFFSLFKGGDISNALATFLQRLFDQYQFRVSRYFQLTSAMFYYSIFSFYGFSQIDPFLKYLQIQMETQKEKKNCYFAVALEVIAGFLKSLKLFNVKSKEVAERVSQVYGLLEKILIATPNEMIQDLILFFNFAFVKRDDKRLSKYNQQLLCNLQPANVEAANEIYKYLYLMSHLLYYIVYPWSSYEYFEQFLKKNTFAVKNFVLMQDRNQRIYAMLISSMIYLGYDSSQLNTSSSLQIIAKPSIQYIKLSSFYLDLTTKTLETIAKLEKAKETSQDGSSSKKISEESSVLIELKNSKITLLSLLGNCCNHESDKRMSNIQIIEKLFPVAISYLIDNEKAVSDTAQEFMKTIISKVYSQPIFEYLSSQLLQNCLTASSWKARSLTLPILANFIRNNWRIAKKMQLGLKIQPCLFDSNVEVRHSCGALFSAILGLYNESETQELYMQLKEIIEKSLPIRKTDEKSEYRFYGGLVGISSIIKSNHGELKSWLPKMIAYISKYKANYGEASNVVKLCLSDFWNRHRSIWEHEKEKFTESEIEAISEHENPYSYYA